VRVGSVEIDEGIAADVDAILPLFEITDEDVFGTIIPIDDEPIEVLVFVDITVVVFINDVLFE